jgi:ribose transport system ATP-binding protein
MAVSGTFPMLLNLLGMTKRFGGIIALDGVDFDLAQGEIHALLGENGAGKSTLINLIAGTYPWDEGHCTIDQTAYAELTPLKSRKAGIAAVFQEFSLVPDLTVEENLFLGAEVASRFFLDRKTMRRKAVALFDEVGFDVPLGRQVQYLTRAQKQMVEITKGLRGEAKILILDEPTASLTDGEAEKLFSTVNLLKMRGMGIIYVSHRMAEIRLLSDRLTVLRGGRKVGSVSTSLVTDHALMEMMVGEPIEKLYPTITTTPGDVTLSAENVTTSDTSVRAASITARAGEIVGLAGLVGCGRSELCRAIFGLEAMSGGRIEVKGQTASKINPHSMLRMGICYFPPDRGAEGLALTRSARENVTMTAFDVTGISSWGIINPWAERKAAERPLRDLALRPMAIELPASSFSGGNQQKIMLARGSVRPIDVYLFDEPTVGVDVGAKRDVYQLMQALVEAGKTVVLSSSDLAELVHLSTRLYVMRKSQIVAELKRDEIDEAKVLHHYFDTATGEQPRRPS